MAAATRAAELVAQEVRTRIISGELAPGERLGSAALMQTEYGVSGPTLREALRILEAQSLIEISRGRNGGARVRRPSGDHALRGLAMVLQQRNVTLSDVHQARAIIEPSAVFHLAEAKSRRPAVRRLRRIVDSEIASVQDPATYAAVSATFHQALVVESGNKTLALFVEILSSLLQDAALSGAALAAASSMSTRLTSIESHTRVLQLIEDGMAVKAEAFWRKELKAVQRFLLANQARSRVVELSA